MKGRAAFLLAAFSLAMPACGNEEEVSRLGESGPRATSTLAAPTSFSETRSAILSAADSGDYAALRPLIEADTFLSDFGFGEESDPVGRWEKMGSEPLETMGVLLRMKHVVRKTNDGTLYQWPSYDPDSDPSDLTPKDRDLFTAVMPRAELERMITDEYGYTGPRLGILEDGTWWFFILEGGP
jgi:hypothetical protein